MNWDSQSTDFLKDGPYLPLNSSHCSAAPRRLLCTIWTTEQLLRSANSVPEAFVLKFCWQQENKIELSIIESNTISLLQFCCSGHNRSGPGSSEPSPGRAGGTRRVACQFRPAQPELGSS